MRPASSLAVLLLAGGASSRMGKPKALLDCAGRPLWRVQMEKLEALPSSEMFLSAPPELSLSAPSWRILHDEEKGLGPLAGLHAALHAMTADWLVVLAIDLPDMTAAFLRRLYDESVLDGRGLIPQRDGFYEGLAAVYPRALLPLCEVHLAGADRSLQHLVRRGVAEGLLHPYPLAEQDRPLFRNVNRPADL